MAELLVSVRSVEEAVIALEAGAAIIDVKEPQRGSLGRADDAVIADIVNFVAGRRPVSAAMGELLDNDKQKRLPDGLTFVKWGLSGCARRPDWPELLANQQARTSAQVVFVAYADWQLAQAPAIGDVLKESASAKPQATLLLDTFSKSDRTLLDWLSVQEIIEICEQCRGGRIRVALAGSLGSKDICLLRSARPDWFAVRGAVCAGGRRYGLLREYRVRNY